MPPVKGNTEQCHHCSAESTSYLTLFQKQQTNIQDGIKEMFIAGVGTWGSLINITLDIVSFLGTSTALFVAFVCFLLLRELRTLRELP